jgi:protein NirF
MKIALHGITNTRRRLGALAIGFLTFPLLACDPSADDAKTVLTTAAVVEASAVTAEPGPPTNVAEVDATGIGSRVYVVEREDNRLAIYDFVQRKLLPERVTGLGNMNHATMTFSPDLRYGYVATRDGVLNRIDLQTMSSAGSLQTSKNSIDLAISQDGRYLAVAEYIPGGVSIVDLAKFETAKRIPAKIVDADGPTDSRVTGMVDAPGNRFVCVLMEGREVWIIDASKPEFPIERRIPLSKDVGLAYDAMITPDGRYYVVAHIGKAEVSVVDLAKANPEARVVSLADPTKEYDADTPVKLPHMASWAVAGDRIFVPLVGEKRLAVLDRHSFQFRDSVPLRGHAVYAVRSPSERELWVSFSGEEDDAYVQVVDTESLEVRDTIEIGARIYHMDFTPRGAFVLVSANRANKLALVDASTHAIVDEHPLESPSGLFGVWRAYRIGL